MANATAHRWDVHGNTRLLKYAAVHGPRLLGAYPGRQRAVHRILNRFKHGWAQDMWDAQRDGLLPPDGGEAWWNANMQRAEAEIADLHSSPQGLEADGARIGTPVRAPEPSVGSFDF